MVTPSTAVRKRPLQVSIALLSGTVALGLAVRFAPIGLPALVVKYGASMLWALMLYWAVSTVLPGWRVKGAACFAAALAMGVEFFKLYHSPGMDRFRHTVAGILLLGRIFSVWDIAVYLIAIAGGAVMDQRIRRREGV